MRLMPLVALALGLGLAACGGDDSATMSGAAPMSAAQTQPDSAAPQPGTTGERPAAKQQEPPGRRIQLAGSPFGEMLYDARRQAIYIFENDPQGETVCYGECAEAWPPVYTEGEPVAGDGVRASLLGTIERRDGRKQVTYAGKPLYFYVNEGPGEVRCHNVNLNGGLWWVVGADGERLA